MHGENLQRRRMFQERPRLRLKESATPGDRVIDEQHDDRSHDRDEHRVDVEPRDSRAADMGEDVAAHESADDPENDVEDAALTALINDPARDEARDQAENNPRDDIHVQPPFIAQRQYPSWFSSRFIAMEIALSSLQSST